MLLNVELEQCGILCKKKNALFIFVSAVGTFQSYIFLKVLQNNYMKTNHAFKTICGMTLFQCVPLTVKEKRKSLQNTYM